MTTADDDCLRILHLSDTHVFGDDSLHYGVVDTRAALNRVLEHAGSLEKVDVVVASGDLSEDGSVASYQHLRRTLETWAGERGARVVYAMGNHDNPDAFEEILGGREGAIDVNGFHVVYIDSSVPGAAFGQLSAPQLTWLRNTLREPARFGSIVVVHHPPIPASTSLLGKLELQHPRELLSECGSADVRLILSGHYHHNIVTGAGGISVVVAPGIANTSDALAPNGTERATVGSGYALIELPESGAPRTVIVSVPGPNDGTEVFALDEKAIEDIARTYGSDRH